MATSRRERAKESWRAGVGVCALSCLVKGGGEPEFGGHPVFEPGPLGGVSQPGLEEASQLPQVACHFGLRVDSVHQTPEVLRQRPLFGLAVPKGARVPARSGGAKWLLVAQVVDLAPLAELAKALEGPLVPRRVLRLGSGFPVAPVPILHLILLL